MSPLFKTRVVWHTRYVPNDGRLNDILAVLVNRLQHIRRLGLLLGLDRRVEVDTDLLGLEVYGPKGFKKQGDDAVCVTFTY